MKVLHVITGLHPGGAERMLQRLVAHLDPSRFTSGVVSLTDVGPVGLELRAVGVSVTAVGMRPGRPDPLGLLRLARLTRGERPDVVQTWMYHADLVGGLAARLAGVTAVAWNIRHTDLPRESTGRGTRWTVEACSRLSHRVPARIVCCAEAARRTHVALGYDDGRMLVIPNGVDLTGWGANDRARREVRGELGIAENAPVVGLVGRFHPQKDHRTFARAAGQLGAALPDARFVLVGAGVTADNRELTGWLDDAGVLGRTHLLGLRSDLPRLMTAIDVSGTTSAHGEGFPNVVAEAMASGVPCVVTDVGEAAVIVGDTGCVVATGDAEAIAAAWLYVLSASPDGRRRMGTRARARVEAKFDIVAVAGRYGALYVELASGRAAAR